MGATGSRAVPQRDGRSVAKALGAFDYDLLPDRQTPLDRYVVTIRHPDADLADRDRPVGPHHVDERPLRARLDGPGRHHRRAPPGLEPEPGVDELAGEQPVIGVRELGPEADGAGGG